MGHASEEIVIRGIRNREDNAFHYLQVKFRYSIRLMVLESGGTEEDARDVFNDGIEALIRLADREDFRLNCRLGTLVYAICSKIWKQLLKKKRHLRKYLFMKEDDRPEGDFSEDQDQQLYREIFWNSFRQLNKSCQEILESYLLEVPPREIAEKTGRSYGYIRKKKSLCHGYLMEMIESHRDFRMIMREEKLTT
ncbi:MAG: sigma-70 family RNA polymerase sigma factor, partial [Bacteroidetes bacterium]